MRVCFFITLLFSWSSFAKDCHLWSVKGTVVYERPHYYLLSAEGTLSEKKLSLPLEEQHKLAVFLNHAVEAKVLLAEKEVPRIGNILKIESAERIVPDPLKDNRETLFRQLGNRPCP